MPTNAQIATITAATVLTGVVGYAVYFDYRRRNDVGFRKQLKREHKKLHGLAARQEKEQKEKTSALLKAQLVDISKEPLPTSPEDREAYFMEQVAMGEGLAQAGPINEVPAALCFYRALRVYPSPVELIMIYQKTVPESIFKLIMDLTSMDVSSTAPAGAALPSSSTDTKDAVPQVAASAADVDDEPTSAEGTGVSSPEASASGASQSGSGSGSGSGGEWETLTDEGKAAAGVTSA